MATLNERLAAKQAEVEKLLAQKKALEQKQKAGEAKKRRAADNISKILIGAAVLASLKDSGNEVRRTMFDARVFQFLTEKDRNRLKTSLEIAGYLDARSEG